MDFTDMFKEDGFAPYQGNMDYNDNEEPKEIDLDELNVNSDIEDDALFKFEPIEHKIEEPKPTPVSLDNIKEDTEVKTGKFKEIEPILSMDVDKELKRIEDDIKKLTEDKESLSKKVEDLKEENAKKEENSNKFNRIIEKLEKYKIYKDKKAELEQIKKEKEETSKIVENLNKKATELNSSLKELAAKVVELQTDIKD